MPSLVFLLDAKEMVLNPPQEMGISEPGSELSDLSAECELILPLCSLILTCSGIHRSSQPDGQG
jgi:hypothetical protein